MMKTMQNHKNKLVIFMIVLVHCMLFMHIYADKTDHSLQNGYNSFKEAYGILLQAEKTKDAMLLRSLVNKDKGLDIRMDFGDGWYEDKHVNIDFITAEFMNLIKVPENSSENIIGGGSKKIIVERSKSLPNDTCAFYDNTVTFELIDGKWYLIKLICLLDTGGCGA